MLYRGRGHYPYRNFEIPKKGGGTRQISAPHPSIKILQAKVAALLSELYKPPRAAQAYIPGRGIVSNARHHQGKRWILNVDLRDFFPSINFGRVYGMLVKKYHFSEPVATVISQICTTENHLPQGAPSSPVLSNMICEPLDTDLHRIAREYGCWYTRYADDITISTRSESFPDELCSSTSDEDGERLVLGSTLEAAVTRAGFVVNDRKVWLRPNSRRQRVTGITVNDGLNVPRRHIRRIRAMLYSWEREGLQAAEARLHRERDPRRSFDGAPAPTFPSVVRGMIEYVGMVKGHDDPVYQDLLARWSSLHLPL